MARNSSKDSFSAWSEVVTDSAIWRIEVSMERRSCSVSGMWSSRRRRSSNALVTSVRACSSARA
jgi:hypothetical protein